MRKAQHIRTYAFLLTVRPLDEQGRWQCKTEKEYLCMKNGEEQDFTADHSYSCRAAGQ